MKYDKWLDCGEGMVKHPVSDQRMLTRVVELKGFGRIGEWLDYSNTAEENFRKILAAPQLFEQLQDIIKCLRRGDLGDISPMMDEIFDAEDLIKEIKGETHP